MAVDFGNGNTSNYYTAADSSALTIPNDQFAVVWWARIDDNSGTAFKYLISTNTYFATSSLNIFIEEDSVGDGDDGSWNVAFVDDSDNGPGQLISSGKSFDDSVDRMYVFQRTSSQFQLWSCVKGSGDATLQASASIGSTGASNGSTWNIGRRSDGNSARYFEEHAGEIAFISGSSLSETQIESLANATQTITAAGFTPEAYWSLNDANDTTDDAGNSHTLTKHGSPSDSGFQFISAGGSGTLTLTDLTNHRIFQRSGTTADIAMAGSYTGTAPNHIQGRVLAASDGTTVVKDWTTLTSATISGGTWSGTLASVAQGGMYFLEARSRDVSNNVLDTDAGTNQWGVGLLALVAGSSSAEKWEEQGTGSPDTTSKVYHDGSWKAPTGTGGVAFANKLATALSIPVATINAGVTSTEWTDWDNDADTSYAACESIVTAVGGSVEAVIVVGLGSNDAANGNVPDNDYYADEARNFISLIRSHVGNANLPIFLNAPNRRTSVADVQAQRVKVGWYTVIGDSNVYGVAQTFDQPLADGVHLSDAGYGVQGERSAVAVNDIIGSGTYHRGPSIVSAGAVDATHTDVAISHSGGSDFTPTSAITGFTITDDNWSGTLAISAAVRQNATTIRLTHASASGSRRVRYQYGADPTVTGAVLDNSTAATGGLPLAYLADDAAVAEGGSLPVLVQHYRRMKVA